MADAAPEWEGLSAEFGVATPRFGPLALIFLL
jgi:hypothetical protein